MIPRIRPESSISDIFKTLFRNRIDRELEMGLMNYFSVKNAIITPSARSGIYFILKALPQEHVFMPVYTCWVVVEAAKLANKKVIFIDIELSNYNMDCEKLSEKIIKNSIILATHQFGIPINYETIAQISADNDCVIIEDNAAGFGSSFRGTLTGTLGLASVISFENSKTISAGRGGAVLTNDKDLYQKIKTAYDSESTATNYYWTTIQILNLIIARVFTHPRIYRIFHFLFKFIFGNTNAHYKLNVPKLSDIYLNSVDSFRYKLISVKLLEADKISNARQEICNFYLKNLKNLNKIKIPEIDPEEKCTMMRFPIRVELSERENFVRYLEKNGIDLAHTFSYICSEHHNLFPNGSTASKTVVNLPIYSTLSTSDLLHIVMTINKWDSL